MVPASAKGPHTKLLPSPRKQSSGPDKAQRGRYAPMNESSKANEQADKDSAQTPSGEPSAGSPEPHAAAADYTIAEPELGAAAISEDVAESVDLKAAEAEAARVEQEAELAAQGLSTGLRRQIPLPDFRKSPVQNPEATESAGGSEAKTTETRVEAQAVGAESTPDVQPENLQEPSPPAAPIAPLGASTDGGHGWRRPETSWQQSATPWQPEANPWQSPSQRARSEADAAALSALQNDTADAGEAHTGAAPPPLGPPHGQQTPAADQPTGSAPAQQGAPGTPSVPHLPGGGAEQGRESGYGGPGGHQGGGYRGPSDPQSGGPGTPNGSNKKKLFILLGIVVLGLGLVVLFVSLLIGLFSPSSESADATAVESAQPGVEQSAQASLESAATDPDAVRVPDLSPLKWFEGDCLRGFKDASAPADVVRCNSPHNAQLVGTHYYDDSADFPGEDVLKAKAAQVCKGVVFTSEASGIETLKQSPAYPSESSWNEKDDRRVDCMVWDARDGNFLESSIIK